MNRSPIELWGSQRTTILVVAAYLGFAFIAGIIYLRKRRISSPLRSQRFSFDFRVYAVLIVCCVISVFVMRKYLVSHLLPLIALISPLIAAAIVSPTQFIHRRSIGLALGTLLLLFFGYLLFPRNLVRHFVDGRHSSLGTLRYCYDQQDNDASCGYLAERDAAVYMNKINPSKESVEVLSSYRPYLRVPCNLEGITQFNVIMPLALRPLSGQFTGYQLEWQQEYLKKLQDRKSRIVVVADNGFRVMLAGGPLVEVEQIAGFREFFEQTYQRDTVIHGFTFYTLNSKR